MPWCIFCVNYTVKYPKVISIFKFSHAFSTGTGTREHNCKKYKMTLPCSYYHLIPIAYFRKSKVGKKIKH